MATRTYSKAFIFCVRSNKTSLKLIQESLNLKLNDQFYEFVNTLGNSPNCKTLLSESGKK